MDVTPLIPEGRKIIKAYAPGYFRINEERFEHPVIVSALRVDPWPIDGVGSFSVDSLRVLLEQDEPPEILLIGTGARMAFIKPALRRAIREKGPVADVMDTGAACRTYNVLLAEERRVAAALLPV